jgi:hypothetical protein
LFELLTGHEVFPSPTPFESMRRHAQEPAPAPSSLLPSIPRALDELVEALLHKEPGQRPQSAESVRRWCEAVRLMVASLEERPSNVESAPELSPVRAPTQGTLVAPVLEASPSVEPAANPSRGHAALLAVSLVLMLAVAVAGLTSLESAPAQASPHAAKPAAVSLVMVPPPPPAAPKPDLEPEPWQPPAVGLAAAPEPAPAVPARSRAHARVVPKPSPELTDERLALHKAQLEARVLERERAAGEPDRIVRRLLEGVDLAAAKDESSRRIAWSRLEEIGRQLDGR